MDFAGTIIQIAAWAILILIGAACLVFGIIIVSFTADKKDKESL